VLALLSLYDLPTKRFRSTAAERAALLADLDNVRAAVDWAARGEVIDEMRLDLVGKSSWCFQFASVALEGFERLLSFSRRIDPTLSDRVRARFWLALATLSVAASRQQGFDAAREAAFLFARIGEDEMHFWALTTAIGTAAGLQVVEDVGPLIAQAEQMQLPEWPSRLLSYFEWARFCWFMRQGDAQQALRCARRQHELLVASGLGVRAMLIGAANIGYCELVLGQAKAAEQRVRHALAASTSGVDDGHALYTLMQALVAQGSYDEALECGRMALKGLELGGDVIALLETLALVAAEHGRLHDATFAVGHVDEVRAKRKHVRWPLEVRWRQQLDALLASLSPREQAELTRAGAAAGTRAAFDRAFGDAVVG